MFHPYARIRYLVRRSRHFHWQILFMLDSCSDIRGKSSLTSSIDLSYRGTSQLGNQSGQGALASSYLFEDLQAQTGLMSMHILHSLQALLDAQSPHSCMGRIRRSIWKGGASQRKIGGRLLACGQTSSEDHQGLQSIDAMSLYPVEL